MNPRSLPAELVLEPFYDDTISATAHLLPITSIISYYQQYSIVRLVEEYNRPKLITSLLLSTVTRRPRYDQT